MAIEIISGEHPFHVNLSGKPVVVASSYSEKIVSIGKSGLLFIARFFAALGAAFVLTMRCAPRSFLRIMFIDTGARPFPFLVIAPPRDIYLALFRGAFWAVSLMVTFVKTVDNTLFGGAGSSEAFFLSSFVGKGINASHIKTNEPNIDTSEVPGNVTVGLLRDLFDQINFNDRGAPGYMSSGAREGSDVGNQRRALRKFVNDVENRNAFLGTPGAHDRVGLNKFYDKIESAVRCTLHKVCSDLEAFRALNPDLDNLSDEDRQEYDRLLSEQSRFVVDCGNAGKYCGGRYMATIMDAYYHYCGGADPTQSMQGFLEQVLAQRRLGIARAEIVEKFGTNPHGWGIYMQKIGATLGLPGSEGVVEQLPGQVGGFDSTKSLEDFFKLYTSDEIISAIQEKVRDSQVFRQKISDWLRSQAGEWRKEEFAALAVQKEQEIRAIMADATITVTEEQNAHLQMFSAMLQILQGTELPDGGLPWNDYVEELFALDPVFDYFEATFGHLKQPENPNDRRSVFNAMKAFRDKKNDLKTFCQTPELTEILRAAIGAGALDPAQATRQLIELEKVRRVLESLHLDPAVAAIVVRGGGNLSGAVRSAIEEQRQSEFLAALEGLDRMQAEGLSPKLIEWLLISQGILKPKKAEPVAAEIAVPRRVSDADIAYMWTIQGYMERRDRERARSFFRDGLDPDVFALFWANRAGGQQGASARRCLEEMFDKAHERNTRAVERNTPQLPIWKRVCLVQIPKTLAAISDNLLVQGALCIVAIAALYFASFIALNTVKQFSVAKFLPYMRMKAPEQALKLGSRALTVLHWPANNPLKFVTGGLITGLVLQIFPRRGPVRTLANRLTPKNAINLIFIPLHSLVVSVVCLSITEGLVKSIFDGATRMSHLFNGLARRAEQERITKAKERFVRVALAHNAQQAARQQVAV